MKHINSSKDPFSSMLPLARLLGLSAERGLLLASFLRPGAKHDTSLKIRADKLHARLEKFEATLLLRKGVPVATEESGTEK